MATHLPLVMQNLFNRPIAMSGRHAEMIVAALAGRLDIAALTSNTVTFDRAALNDMAARGRSEARREATLQATRMASNPDGPMIVPKDEWGDAAFFRGTPYPLSKSGIAIIDVLGTLTRTWGCDPYSGSTGYDGIWTKLAYAMDDPAVKGIWLRINSGGGAVDGLYDLVDAVWQCSQRNGGKPIWAFAGDFAYSAAYALAMPCDRVFAPAMGGVGAIGTLAIFIDYTKMMEDEGIKATIFRAPDRKAIGVGGLEALDSPKIDKIQAMIEEATAYFQERAALYRGVSKSTISETRGNDYTATQAKAIGLIDAVLREQDAWSEFERAIAA